MPFWSSKWRVISFSASMFGVIFFFFLIYLWVISFFLHMFCMIFFEDLFIGFIIFNRYVFYDSAFWKIYLFFIKAFSRTCSNPLVNKTKQKKKLYTIIFSSTIKKYLIPAQTFINNVDEANSFQGRL